VTLPRMCPSCGSEDPALATYCPSTPDKCGGCETCDHPFHAQPPVGALTTSSTTTTTTEQENAP